MSQANVDALFFSLATSGILKIQNTTDGIKWVIGCQPPVATLPNHDVSLINATIFKAKYKVDKCWMGISLHPKTRIHVHSPTIPISLIN